MTPRQTALYFREWGYVRGYCKRHRLPEPDRHALHIQALGADKSSKVFSNEEFDRVLAVFRAVHQPANINAQLRQLGEPRTRKLGKIRELLRCLALYHPNPEAYALSIIRDTSKATSIEDLSDEIDGPSETSQIDRLIMDLSRAVNGRHGFRARAGESLHEMRTRAGLECGCKRCATLRRTRLVPAMAMAGDIEDNEPF